MSSSTPKDFEIAEDETSTTIEDALTPTFALSSVASGVHGDGTPTLSATDSGYNGQPIPRSDSSDPLIGTTVADRYELLSVLGFGGWSTVYQAQDNSLNRQVAIKLMHAHLCVDQMKLQRFQREAERASALNHPNIATIHDCGSSNGRPYITMELIEGLSLAEIISEKKQLSAAECKHIFSEICDGIAAIHALGMIHRDLKPSNVKISSTGAIKVLDFGLAKYILQEEQTLTKTDESIGTPAYMSPEQCLGRPLDSRTDIYSLGCMLYESLTGLKPFVADNSLLCMQMHLLMVPARFHSVRADLHIPPGLEHVVHKSLAKNPADRYASASDLKAALAESSKPQGVFSQLSSAINWHLGSLRAHRQTALVFLLVLLTGIATFAGSKMLNTTPQRTIAFPNHPVGVLYLVTRNLDKGTSTEVRYSVAQGSVSVPAPSIIKLGEVPASESKRMEFLSQLRPNDLQVLFLDNLPLSDEALARIGKLKGLQSLNMDGATGITSKGLASLDLQSLGGMGLRDTKITDEGAAALASRLVILDYLSLALNPITDKGANSLLLLRCLKSLNLNKTKVTDQAIVKIATLPRIEGVSLAYDGITDAGIAQLAGVGGMKTIDLHGDSSISDRAVTECFLKLPLLERLDLRSTAVTADGIARLKKAFPNCEILTGKALDIPLDRGRQ